MQISVSSQTTLNDVANFFVFALYDASAPGVLLESQAPPKPYGNPLQITYLHNCLPGRTYIIKLWESADSTPTGQVRNSFSQTVNQNSVKVRLTEFLQVDVTPDLTNDTTQYINDTYEGWDYTVERIGQGTLTPSDSIIVSPKIEKLTGPYGFELIDGSTFQELEEFCVRFEPQVTVTAPSGTPSSPFGAARIITVDEVLDGTDVNTALILQGVPTGLSIGLPALSSVADFSFIYLISNGGNHINAAIKADEAGPDMIYFKGDNATLYMGQCEVMKLFKFNGKWYVDNDLPGVTMVGELLYHYNATPVNTILCNGQELGRGTYPRLWEWVQALGGDGVVSEASWQSTFVTVDGITYYTNRCKFSTGDGSTTFRLPLLTNMMLKAITVGPGRTEIEQVMDHGHFMFGNDGAAGTPYAAKSHIFGTNQDFLMWKVSGAPTEFLTGVPTNDRHGSSNLVNNAGAYCLIRC